MLVIVPDLLRESIHSQLDKLYATLPEEEKKIAELDRETHYQQAIQYFSETGNIPTFRGIEKK
jgi:hypothetical protein